MIDATGRILGEGIKAIPLSKFQEDPLSCPSCKSKDIVISGFFKRGFEQPYKDGTLIKNALVLGPDAIQIVERVVCSTCGINTIIEDNIVYDREGLIFDLQLAIATLQGKSPISPSGQEWKQ